jgi:hypothetical protein
MLADTSFVSLYGRKKGLSHCLRRVYHRRLTVSQKKWTCEPGVDRSVSRIRTCPWRLPGRRRKRKERHCGYGCDQRRLGLPLDETCRADYAQGRAMHRGAILGPPRGNLSWPEAYAREPLGRDAETCHSCPAAAVCGRSPADLHELGHSDSSARLNGACVFPSGAHIRML